MTLLPCHKPSGKWRGHGLGLCEAGAYNVGGTVKETGALGPGPKGKLPAMEDSRTNLAEETGFID